MNILKILTLVFVLNSCESIISTNKGTVEKVNGSTEDISNKVKENLILTDDIKKNDIQLTDNTNKVINNSKDIITIANEINKKTNIVVSEVNSIITKGNIILTLSAKNLELIKKNDEQAIKLESNNKEIGLKNERLKSVSIDLDNLAKIDKEKDDKIAKLESEKSQLLFQKMIWLIIAGILGLCISVANIINGNVGAWRFAIVSSLLIVVSLAVSYFSATLAFSGLIAILIMVGFIGYDTYKHYKTKKALSQVVETTEILKDHLPDDKKQLVFGNGNSVSNVIQSEDTKKLVNDIRSIELKPKFESTITKGNN